MTAQATAVGGRRHLHGKAHALQRRGDDRKNGIPACMLDRDFGVLERSLESGFVHEGEVLVAPAKRPSHLTCGCAVLQRGGHLLRLPTQKRQQLFERGGATQHLFFRYTHSLLGEMGQLAACSRLHSLRQRVCRWLLLNHDITPDTEILQSHESISDALGVRRERVTAAAGRLREEGLNRYRRGHITVVDKERLAVRACECHGRLLMEHDRLLPRQVAT